ncbi:hypothetical protein CHCC20488_4342 [Bacillus paralicheniformis]|nr:hypothetical protein SC10_B2orf02695 [Bacillus paralicheniformis]TWN42937.1 hypothetical protein CHCC14523_1033 [Bacillus paralicheniformis]TWN85470.1 hypothetical protein CHCC20492_0729 [Bacillus paralicheniformis]TWO08331.1 hypothetical protein CHCC20488_4342 [Bacillus paralicheniformis]
MASFLRTFTGCAFRQDAWAGLIRFGGILKAVRKNSEPLRG